MKKDTKAHQIFVATRVACREHIKTWGFEKGMGFNRLFTEEAIYTKTINSVQKELDRWLREINDCEEFGIITSKKAEADKLVAKMIQATINNTIKSEKAFRESLR